jgi:hypothetical protein
MPEPHTTQYKLKQEKYNQRKIQPKREKTAKHPTLPEGEEQSGQIQSREGQA